MMTRHVIKRMREHHTVIHQTDEVEVEPEPTQATAETTSELRSTANAEERREFIRRKLEQRRKDKASKVSFRSGESEVGRGADL